MKRKAIWLAMALAGTALAQDVSVDFDEKADFSQYRTYRWRPERAAAKEANPLARERLERLVNEELARRGMRETTGFADAVFHCRLGTRERREAHTVGGPVVVGPRGGVVRRRGVMVDEYTQGTVVIDMMDARAKQTVWRAWAKDKGDDPVEAMNEKNLRKIVDKAFRKFPRKKG